VMLPLQGLRVVDFGWVWAGAIPGHILADLGAEVIRIESRKPLDFMRQGRPIVGREKDPEQNPVFQNVNRGKLSDRAGRGRSHQRAGREERRRDREFFAGRNATLRAGLERAQPDTTGPHHVLDVRCRAAGPAARHSHLCGHDRRPCRYEQYGGPMRP
jgi:hypothetical protein